MTNEEAINILYGMRADNLNLNDLYTKDKYDALGMAIKALEQEPCEDAISRQAVEKITWEEPSYTDALNVLTEVRDKIRELPSVTPKEPRWIPVSERLPEEKQSVLVWCPEYKNMYCAYLEYKKWWIFGAFCQIIPNAVIAWMPLPQPYMAEGSDKE